MSEPAQAARLVKSGTGGSCRVLLVEWGVTVARVEGMVSETDMDELRRGSDGGEGAADAD